MKRTFLNLTLASVVTLVAYLALYFLWGAILSELENETIRLVLISLMTSAAYAFFLLYFSKIRADRGEKEVMKDYKDHPYISLRKDMRKAWERERKTLLCVGAVILVCLLLNGIDKLAFGKKIISLPTFFFIPMMVFDTCFSIPVVGYAVSGICIGVFYILFVLLHRRKCYRHWMG